MKYFCTLIFDNLNRINPVQISAQAFREFMGRIRNGVKPDTADIVRFAKLFNDELTLDNLNRQQLSSMCIYMGLQPYGTNSFLRFQLRRKLDALKEDDHLIRKEGIDSLSDEELRY